MNEEEKAHLVEAYETVIIFLIQRGYTGEQLMNLGPEGAYEAAKLEYSFMITED